MMLDNKEEAAAAVKLERPEAQNNFVVCLNNKGYMTETLDEVSAQFVEECVALGKHGSALEIGAAYGVAAIPAGKTGCKIHANDLDKRHLQLLADQFRADNKTDDNLVLCPGEFPKDDILPKQHPLVNRILCCRVFHFFDGDTMRKGIQKLKEMLQPTNGKAFVVCETPYLKNMKDTFLPVYLERLTKPEAFEWPGWIEDFASLDSQRSGKNLPPSMHLLDTTVMRREFERAGFVVEKCVFLNRTDFPGFLRLDGRESVGIVARVHP